MFKLWPIMVEVGFVGWVAATLGLIFRAFGKDNKFYAKRALFWGCLVAAFYVIWTIGLIKT
ncbi:MAG: hypothetical protein JSW52_09440 [Candidatus Coatesbacteria bacterium]|nr:MAG: hypothetical protein JSW52_09440 [Candidatus Coatesbacteria bacterium]